MISVLVDALVAHQPKAAQRCSAVVCVGAVALVSHNGLPLPHHISPSHSLAQGKVPVSMHTVEVMTLSVLTLQVDGCVDAD